MSNDLISRSALIECMENPAQRKWFRGTVPLPYVAWAQHLTQSAAAVDVEIVQHGQWRLGKDGALLFAECPRCGMVADATQAAWWNYCPVCGLKTDAEAEDTWEVDTCD